MTKFKKQKSNNFNRLQINVLLENAIFNFLQLRQINKMQKGSALIFVLWIIAILSILAAEIGFKARLNSELTGDEAKLIQNYPQALACLQTGISAILNQNSSQLNHLTGKNFHFNFKEQNYSCQLEFFDEAGKYNLNKVGEKELLEILNALGFQGEKRDTIVDSILDWRDSDNFHRLNGAETDYYQTLNPPYKCKNGNFNSIDELILVKGIDLPVFQKLKQVFSVYANTQKINVNSAPQEVLKTLGLDSRQIQDLQQARKQDPFLDLNDLLSRVPELDPNLVKDKIRFKDSSIYQVKVTVLNNQIKTRTKFILKLLPSEATILGLE